MSENATEYNLSDAESYQGPKSQAKTDETNSDTTNESKGTPNRTETSRKADVLARDMSVIVRETDHECDIHIQNVWETDFGKKVGVVSKKEYADIFSDQLDWDHHHQKWSSERTENTDMWEVDLDSVFAVVSLLAARDVDVTITDEVLTAYRQQINE